MEIEDKFCRHKITVINSEFYRKIRGVDETPSEEDYLIAQAVEELYRSVKSYGGIEIAVKPVSEDGADIYISLFYDASIVAILKKTRGNVFFVHYVRRTDDGWRQELMDLARAHAQMNPRKK